MSNKNGMFSPQLYARTCGFLYLYIIVAGIYAEMFVRSKLIVSSDAGATAANIMANEFVFRMGASGELLQLAFDVMIAVILYALLRQVDRNIALLAAFMRLSCDLVLAVASLGQFAALRLYAGTDSLAAFTTGQLNSLALLALKLHSDAYAVCLVFFGFACIALGFLIYRSTFLPRFIGVLMAVAGVGYLVNSFAKFLSPPLASMLFPAILMPAFVAELSLALWLIVRGVNVQKWQAGATR